MARKYHNVDNYQGYIRETVQDLKSQIDHVEHMEKGVHKDKPGFILGMRNSIKSSLAILRNDAIDFGLPLDKLGLEDEIKFNEESSIKSVK